MSLWTMAVLAVSLGAGFAWVHHGLRAVLEARNDSFLIQKGVELSSVFRDAPSGRFEELESEIRREMVAYSAEGLVVVVRRPGAPLVAPSDETATGLAGYLSTIDAGPAPRTVTIAGTSRRYRVVRVRLEPAGESGYPMDLSLSLDGTEATLAQFDRRVAIGGSAFLALAIAGGLLLSRQALSPVARSIADARHLNPADLTTRLPLSGSGDELDQLAATINDLLDRLAAYHAQGARFTADASHELRSPLAAMRAAVEVALQRPREDHEYRQILGNLGEQCDRLTTLVNGLLLLARADAGQVELRREVVDLAGLVSEVAEMFLPLAEERGVDLKWDRTPPTPVVGDPSRLGQLITNLLDNALKFTETGASVAVSVQTRGDRVHLTVADTGIGIPADHLPHIFERFYQANAARTSEGSGLGLSICRWIAEVHGGGIGASSDPGGGSVFTVTLPVAEDRVPSSTSKAVRAAPEPEG